MVHLAVLCFLGLSATVVAWPVLSGGYLSYLDNPAHLAELHALASEGARGWSDVAVAGLPLGTLHSPLLYGGTAQLVRWGLPLETLYVFWLWLGAIAPALAVYAIARRRRVSGFPAAALAWLVLVQRPNLEGVASPLGGMWTFGIAAALWLLLLDHLSRRQDDSPTLRSGLVVAVLVAAIGLLHLYVLVATAVLAVAVLALGLLSGPLPRKLPVHAAFAALGLATAASYWLAVLLGRAAVLPAAQNLTFVHLLLRFLLPNDLIAMLSGASPVPTDLLLTDALLLLGLISVGLVGARLCWTTRDPLLLAPVTAGLLLALLLAAPWLHVTFLGPNSWRYVELVRPLLAVMAIPLLVKRPSLPASLAVALAILATVSCVWWGRPLASQATVPEREMAEVRQLWQWLRDHRQESWGRVYVQNTFHAPPASARLYHSHLLALTSWETGVRQVGAWYGILPVLTWWSGSELGSVARLDPQVDRDVPLILERLERLNAGLLVLSAPGVEGSRLDTHFQPLAHIGRFRVLAWRSPVRPHWAVPVTGDVEIERASVQTGRVALELQVTSAPAAVRVSAAWHPAWRIVEGPPGAVLRPDPDGLLLVDHLARGRQTLRLEWIASPWPGRVSFTGAAMLALLLVLAWRGGLHPSGRARDRRPEAV